MLKTHEKFHSSNGKRLVLIVDDEEINRELLNVVLQDEYETLQAPDGERALEIIRENSDTLSLILLDLLMPGLHGLDVIKTLKNDQELKKIPVIVLTADQEAEVSSLQLGASDFIPKPYPKKEVILTRVSRSIELSEDQDIIQSTERDKLTGLYNREYFYRYAQQFDQHHKDLDMDAIVIDIHHFRMINERYGKAYGDEVLRRIGEKVRAIVRDSEGIVCRQEADTFLVYCPHREDYGKILESASIGLTEDETSANRVRLRMGVYEHVDRNIEIERRFDRAKMAADTVRGNFLKGFALYDNELHESEIYAEQLLEDFDDALAQRQFTVFYQPKFDVRPEIPVLASAEALVRWQHPKMGMINPGVFIPLFEENGLIQQLDFYVWNEAASQIRDWKQRLGISVPVSVNVSRIDMYDPNLISTLQHLLEKYELTAGELLLEITESAYTQDSEQIISTVNRLRDLGFRIEMDDFGTGYSSLNMISSLPIDALKLDMKFIRNAFRDGGDTRLLEIIIDIADYLSVPVIAEGVETAEQLDVLRSMGCDLVQGYYFSKPVPASEYEYFVEKKKNQMSATENEHASVNLLNKIQDDRSLPARIVHALTSDFEVIYYVDTESGQYVQFSAKGRFEDLQIERSGSDFFGDTQRNILQVVYQEDRERVSLFLQKDALLAQLMGGYTFSLTYRLIIDARPVYYNLRAVNAFTKDEHHIIIGVGNVETQIQQADGILDGEDRNHRFFSIAQALSSAFERISCVDDQMKWMREFEKARKDNVTFSSIMQALTADYISIYYINTVTDRFVEFSAHDDYETLGIEKEGEDFFNLSRRNILRVVHPEDREEILIEFTKENLLEEMRKTGSFTLNYRLMFGGAPTYVSLKATHMADPEDPHIVIGVNNIDAQIRRQMEYDAAKAQTMTYSRIARALSRNYYSIYIVNTETDEFIEYSSNSDDQELQVEQNGENFFDNCRRNYLEQVHEEDQDMALAVWDKSRLMKELEGGKTFSTTYRMMMGNETVYINCKVNRMEDQHDSHHIVIGISNVDEQMKREKELHSAREKANRDALTGVKSKHAYVETTRGMNREIVSGTAPPFAVAVCDVNGLKTVNDTLGHQAGDKLILDASHRICDTFKHSPVFRIGGDEFVAILLGSDYEQREALISQMTEKNMENQETGGVIIACGCRQWIEGQDDSFEDVFARADAAMYENKAALKI